MKKWLFIIVFAAVLLLAGIWIGRTDSSYPFMRWFSQNPWGYRMGNMMQGNRLYLNDQVNLVIQSGTGKNDGKFVIDNMANPTIYIPENAFVTLQFDNQDKDVPHGFEVTTAVPPYDQMAMMDGAAVGNSIIPPLPEAHNQQYPVGQTAFRFNQPGQYYYICQYPGHAAKGMYGKMVVE